MSDHRPLLAEVGLEIEAYDETVDWSQRQRVISERLLASVDELANESGDDPVVVRQGLEEMAATQDTMSRRVFIVANAAEHSAPLQMNLAGIVETGSARNLDRQRRTST